MRNWIGITAALAALAVGFGLGAMHRGASDAGERTASPPPAGAAQRPGVAASGAEAPGRESPLAEPPAWARELQSLLRQEQVLRQALTEQVDHLAREVRALQDDGGEPAAALRAAPVPAPTDTALAAPELPALPAGAAPDATSLMALGVESGQAESFAREQGALAMRRLELRDEAIRGGWENTQRYFDALRALEGDAPSLREALGDEIYDRFLYSTGQPNRVKITSIIPGSPAEQFGLRPGDLVEAYGEERLFLWNELQAATSAGRRGDPVPLRIRRGERDLEIVVPRGPLGVSLETTRVAPP